MPVGTYPRIEKSATVLVDFLIVGYKNVACLADDETGDGLDFDISDGPPNPTNIINEVRSFNYLSFKKFDCI